MYRWCAYCQHYLGEKAPLDDYSLTHSICSECVSRDMLSDDNAVERQRPLVAFYRDVLGMVQTGESLPVAAFVRRGLDLGMRPVDLLVGILQPTLYEVGRLWDQGRLTPAQETSFSVFCDAVVTDLSLAQERLSPPRRAPLVLLLNAHWNRHTLGLRMATFLLREKGHNAEALILTPPLGELQELLVQRKPAVVGVSLATSWQLPFLDALLPLVASLVPRPRLVAGGPAVRAGCELPAGVEAWSLFEGLLAP